MQGRVCLPGPPGGSNTARRQCRQRGHGRRGSGPAAGVGWGGRSPALLLPGPRLRSPRGHGELVADMQVCRHFLKQGGPCAPRGKGGGGQRAGRGRCTALPDDGQPWGRLHGAGVAGSGRHRRGHAGRVAVPRLDRSLGRPALGLTSPEARSQVTQRRLYESSRKAGAQAGPSKGSGKPSGVGKAEGREAEWEARALQSLRSSGEGPGRGRLLRPEARAWGHGGSPDMQEAGCAAPALSRTLGRPRSQ